MAEIFGVSESEFDAFLTEKFPPNERRGTSGVYYSAFGESVKQSLQNAVLCNTKMRQFIKRNKIQLMNLTCLDEDGVLVVPTKEQVLYIVSYACRVLEFMFMYKYVWAW